MEDYGYDIEHTVHYENFAKRVQPHPVIEFIYFPLEQFKMSPIEFVVRTYVRVNIKKIL